MEDNGLQRVVDVRKQRTDDSGREVIIGAAAKQKEIDRSSVAIDGTSVEEINISETTADYTEFVAVPDEFIVVDSSSGTFLFDLIGRHTGAYIERASLDLNDFIDSLDNKQTWQVGIYDHFGKAEKGTLYGNNLLNDEDFGEILGIADKNQLGITYTQGDTKYKLTMTESGYVDVYDPDFDSEEFAEFVLEHLYNSLA
jgi:hypothetical protein